MKMGGHLCCLKQSSPDGRPKDVDNSGLKDNPILYSPVPHRRKENTSAKIAKVRRSTLEEWMLNSPAMKPGCRSVGDIPVFKQAGKVRPMICSPSSMNVHAQLSQSRNVNVHTHLSVDDSPSTMGIKTHFSKSSDMMYMERKMRVANPSRLSRESRQMKKEEKVGESIEGGLVSCHRKSKSTEIESVEEGNEEGLVPCLRKSKSMNSGKRVRFRLPEDADIYIFYELEDEESCYY